jgi:hypothetical protein
MKIYTDFCIVKVKDILLDKVPAMGPNGFFWANPSFDPSRHTMTEGIVDAIPNGLFRMPLVGKHISLPAYHDGNPMFPWKTTEDIVMEVRVGDKIHFHYGQLLPDDHERLYNHQYIKSKIEIENGQEVPYHYFKIRYSLIFAAVRYHAVNPMTPDFQWWMEPELQEYTTELSSEDIDTEERTNIEKVTRFRRGDHSYMKQIQMIGSWTMIEVDKENWDDISLPTPETINGKLVLDEKGQRKMKPKEEWLVVKSAPANRYLCGWVRHVGTPLLGDTCYLEPGMHVYFRPNADTLMRFEGKEYYRMIQRNIIGWTPYIKQKTA